MVKKLIGLICALGLLNGCLSVTPPPSPPSQSPDALNIHDQNQTIIGKAVHVEGDIFVTPDHLFVDHGDLFGLSQRAPLKIWLRDFEHDILFFKLATPLNSENTFSKNPPAIGKILFWKDADQILSSSVEGIKASFSAQDNKATKKNLLVFSGHIKEGLSGTPLFDEKGVIYGIIIAADRSKNQIYALRSDIMQALLEENQE
ncbi:MAG TPA: hypothetical protein VIT68_01525 [Candidatus Gracilibacteria bacterium]